MDLQDNDSLANLKDLMTAAPTSPEEHAGRCRQIVKTRRRMEDVREQARERAADPLQAY